jgi:hypothetical protein
MCKVKVENGDMIEKKSEVQNPKGAQAQTSTELFGGTIIEVVAVSGSRELIEAVAFCPADVREVKEQIVFGEQAVGIRM